MCVREFLFGLYFPVESCGNTRPHGGTLGTMFLYHSNLVSDILKCFKYSY